MRNRFGVVVGGSLFFRGSPPSPRWPVLVLWSCLAVLAVGALRAWPCFRALVFVMFVLPFGFVAAPAAPVVSAVAAPVAASAPVAGFVPASLRVGARVVPASAFLPVASGVVSGLSGLGVRASGGFSCVVGGVAFRCLASGLGGAGSPAFLGLLGALRAARSSGVPVSLVGAPGARGVVCPGFFCGVVVASPEAVLADALADVL
jgi:hypothetical protein